MKNILEISKTPDLSSIKKGKLSGNQPRNKEVKDSAMSNTGGDIRSQTGNKTLLSL